MVGKKIKELRKRQRMSQRDLAKHLGLTQQSISYWERGMNGIQIDMLWPIARALRVHAKELLDEPAKGEGGHHVNNTRRDGDVAL